MQFLVSISFLIPLLPLLGAIVSGFFGDKYLREKSHLPIWIGVGASAVLSTLMLLAMMNVVHHVNANAGTVGITRECYTWIEAGGFKATAGFFFDPLTVIMMTVVTVIGFFITVFAAGYMKGEAGYARFFAYLGLFIFSMTCLVMGSNLLMLYLGWEGVGLCSYLLIGYYYERPAAREAAKKAFIVNRVGDFGFSLGIMSTFLVFGTISYFGTGVGTYTGFVELATLPVDQLTKLGVANAGWAPVALQYIPFLLMLGAFGKSAQFPLYVWLPDAMEGPTPVSALIHAATMVTAGIYMIVRCGTLFVSNQAAMTTLAAVGAFTALFAATIALRQFDLKKVFAYSTISQLGYMFVGVGILAPSAAVFHLITHAFFKALLFLSSGVVMHAMLGHLDMRKMSGLKAVLPKTRWLILIGCCALAGVPLFSGFFSKDEIIGQTWSRSALLGGVLLFTAFLTAYYTFRLYFQVFEGPLLVPTTPADEHGHDEVHASGLGTKGTDTGTEHVEARASHEAVIAGQPHSSGIDEGASHDHHDHEPNLLMIPLYVLAAGALLAGYLNWPFAGISTFLGHSPSIQSAYVMASARYDTVMGAVKVNGVMFGVPAVEKEPVITAAMLVGGIVSLFGIGLAYVLHLKQRAAAERIAAGLQPLTGLLEGKYWVDEIYQSMIVEPLRELGRIFFALDRILIDGLVWMVGMVPQVGGFVLKLGVQRGYLQGYAAAMLFGILAILLFVFL